MSEKSATPPRPLRAKLIFNTTAGRVEHSPQQLVDILNEMQNQDILTEVFMVGPDSSVEEVVRGAIRGGIKLIVVAGGDGTIDRVAGAMMGSSATLGIIPTGTRNNVAFNLGIPNSIAAAVALLREGRRLKIDLGLLRSGEGSQWFLEGATLGLLTDLYSAADHLQHGDLGQIGSLLSTFVSSTPSQLHLVLDRRQHHAIDAMAYMVLIANMPYLGPHFQISSEVSFNDGHLDVFVFSDMTKLDLISYAMQSAGGAVEDPRIKHYRARRLTIQSDPQMPVLADGVLLEPSTITALVRYGALAVMVGATDDLMQGPSVPTLTSEPDGPTNG